MSEKSNVQKDYYKLVYHNPVIKHYCMGMSRWLILWIIKYHSSIHGYGILKELDKFYSIFIEEESLKKSNPSNIYPILNRLEESGLIEHDLKVENNKSLKYFKITDDGIYILAYLYSRFDIIHNNDAWKVLFEDMEKM